MTPGRLLCGVESEPFDSGFDHATYWLDRFEVPVRRPCGRLPHASDLTERVAPTGHFVAEEAPDWFIETLDDFLARAHVPGV